MCTSLREIPLLSVLGGGPFTSRLVVTLYSPHLKKVRLGTDKVLPTSLSPDLHRDLPTLALPASSKVLVLFGVCVGIYVP